MLCYIMTNSIGIQLASIAIIVVHSCILFIGHLPRRVLHSTPSVCAFPLSSHTKFPLAQLDSREGRSNSTLEAETGILQKLTTLGIPETEI